MRGNQTSICFECMPPAVEEYLSLPVEEPESSSEKESESSSAEGDIELVTR